MKIKIVFILIIYVYITFSSYSIYYTNTAESIAWNGAYTSVSEGFEAMLYNPAGLFLTNKSFGLIPFVGSLGLRYYVNSFSTDEVMNIFYQENRDISAYLNQKFLNMDAYNINFETGINFNLFNFMIYKKLKNFSVGFSFIPRMYLKVNIHRNLFKIFLQGFDLDDGEEFYIKLNLAQYFDAVCSLSSRVGFLEKRMPFFEEIYAGMSLHFYLPVIFASFTGNGSIVKNEPQNLFGILSYTAHAKGDLTTGGILQSTVSDLFYKRINFDLFPNSTLDNQIYETIMSNGGSSGFGFGLDFGTIVVVNKLFSFGLSFTDIGFILYPRASNIDVDFSFEVDPYSLMNGEKQLPDSMKLSLGETTDRVFAVMPNASIRTGAVFSPLKNNYCDIIIAGDLALSDMNKLFYGEYPAFNFSMGVEINPKIRPIFQFPIRTGFNFNTESLNFSFSFGLGFYIGAVEFDIGIKGLEILVEGWGAKDIEIGIDLKYEFK